MKRHPKKLKLGEHYIVYFDNQNKMICKFIKVTKCGFNFLNINTNKCILPHHLYPSKCKNHSSGDWYWINDRMNINN